MAPLRRQGRGAWPPGWCFDADAQLDLCDAQALHHGSAYLSNPGVTVEQSEGPLCMTIK